MNQPVIVRIDVLSVEGMDGNQAASLGSEFQSTLRHLIETRGLPRALSRPGEQPVIEIDPPAGVRSPANLAAHLAEALYRRLDE